MGPEVKAGSRTGCAYRPEIMAITSDGACYFGFPEDSISPISCDEVAEGYARI